jgi:hypothetical protein
VAEAGAAAVGAAAEAEVAEAVAEAVGVVLCTGRCVTGTS